MRTGRASGWGPGPYPAYCPICLRTGICLNFVSLLPNVFVDRYNQPVTWSIREYREEHKPSSCTYMYNFFVHVYLMTDTRMSYIALAWDLAWKPNSWTYNFIEVSGHNIQSSQTWGVCMDFIYHREGGMIFYQVFLLYRNFKRFREFEEIVISRQICRGDCELQGGKLLRLLSEFRPRIRPQISLRQSQLLRCKMILLIHLWI
jgi:hypothetical protein